MINPATLAVGAFTFLTAAVVGSAKAYEQSAQAQAKLNSVLESTGGAAGLNADQLNSMAAEMSRLTNVEDDLITNSQAVLLTFTRIKSDAFEPAMQAALDMSAVLGGDLQGSVIQVGKAMNDFSGYAALKKAGVSFTEEQIEQIEKFKETNDLVGYQQLLLNELGTEFGGAAKKMKEASLGGEAVKNSFGNLQEAVGGANAGWIQDFNRGLTYTIDTLTDWINRNNEAAATVRNNETAYIDYARSLGMTGPELEAAGLGLKEFTKRMDYGKAMTEFYTNALGENSDALGANGDALIENAMTAEEIAAAQQDLVDSSNQYMSVLGEISSETEAYNEKNQELLDKLAALTAEQANTAEWSSKYAELNDEIAVTQGEIATLAEQHNQASQKIIFDLISQQAAANGFKDISVQALAKIGEQWGVLAKGSGEATATTIAQAEAWTEALANPVQKLTDIIGKYKALKKLSETGIVITAEIVYNITGGAMGGLGENTGSCFTGDTLVTLGDGSHRPIRDIQKGDAVLSYNTDTKQQLVTIVAETFEHIEQNNMRLLLINNYLRVTEEHALWNGSEWKYARFFEVGDLLMNIDGSYQTVTSIAEIPKDEPTYNLHVDHEVHNYFAGGVLVHNTETKWHGGQLSGNGWTLVGDRKGGGFIKGASELISPSGYVVDSATSEKLIKLGLVDYKSMAFGSGDSGYTNPAPAAPIYTPPAPKPGGSRAGGGGSGAVIGGGMLASDIVAADTTQASNTQENLQMQQEAAQQAQQAAQENKNLLMELIDSVKDLPAAIGKEVSYQVAIGS